MKQSAITRLLHKMDILDSKIGLICLNWPTHTSEPGSPHLTLCQHREPDDSCAGRAHDTKHEHLKLGLELKVILHLPFNFTLSMNELNYQINHHFYCHYMSVISVYDHLSFLFSIKI